MRFLFLFLQMLLSFILVLSFSLIPQMAFSSILYDNIRQHSQRIIKLADVTEVPMPAMFKHFLENDLKTLLGLSEGFKDVHLMIQTEQDTSNINTIIFREGSEDISRAEFMYNIFYQLDGSEIVLPSTIYITSKNNIHEVNAVDLKDEWNAILAKTIFKKGDVSAIYEKNEKLMPVINKIIYSLNLTEFMKPQQRYSNTKLGAAATKFSMACILIGSFGIMWSSDFFAKNPDFFWAAVTVPMYGILDFLVGVSLSFKGNFRYSNDEYFARLTGSGRLATNIGSYWKSIWSYMKSGTELRYQKQALDNVDLNSGDLVFSFSSAFNDKFISKDSSNDFLLWSPGTQIFNMSSSLTGPNSYMDFNGWIEFLDHSKMSLQKKRQRLENFKEKLISALLRISYDAKKAGRVFTATITLPRDLARIENLANLNTVLLFISDAILEYKRVAVLRGESNVKVVLNIPQDIVTFVSSAKFVSRLLNYPELVQQEKDALGFSSFKPEKFSVKNNIGLCANYF